MNNDLMERALRIRQRNNGQETDNTDRVNSAREFLQSLDGEKIHNRNAHIADLIDQRERNAMDARGRQMIRDQQYRDFVKANPPTADDLVTGASVAAGTTFNRIPSVSNAQAFRNQHGKSAQQIAREPDKTVMLPTANAPTYTSPQINEIYNRLSGMEGQPTSPVSAMAQDVRTRTATQSTVENEYRRQREEQRQSVSNIANPAYRMGLEQTLRRYDASEADEQKILAERSELVNALTFAEQQMKETFPIPVANEDYYAMQKNIADLQARIAEYDKRLDEVRAQNEKNGQERAGVQRQLRESEQAPYYLLMFNDDFQKNADFRAKDDADALRLNGRHASDYAAAKEEKEEMITDEMGRMNDIGWQSRDYMDTLEEGEKQIYNYLYNTQGKDAAQKYIDTLKPELEGRAVAKASGMVYQFGKEHPIIGNLASVVASPLRAAGAVGALVDRIAGGNVNPNAFYNRPSQLIGAERQGADERIQSDVSKLVTWLGGSEDAQRDVAGLGSFVNNAVLSGLESAWNGKLSQAVAGSFGMSFSEANMIKNLPGASADLVKKADKVINAASEIQRVVMGAGAVSDAIREAKERGLSDDQAFTLGMIAGFAEYGTEKWSVENLFNTDWTPKSVGSYLLKGLKQGGFEASEEVISDIVNKAADVIVAKDKSEWQKLVDQYANDPKVGKDNAVKQAFLDNLWDIAKSGASGFLSSFGPVIGETVRAGAYNAQFQTHNDLEKLGKKNGTDYIANLDGLLNQAMETDEDGRADALAQFVEEVGKTYPKDTVKRSISYIQEAVRQSGDSLDRANLGILEKTLRNNQAAINDALNRNKAKTETAESQQPDNTVPTTYTPDMELDENGINQSVIPGAPWDYDENGQRITANTETGTEQGTETQSVAAQEAVQEQKVVPAAENAPETNTAQNASAEQSGNVLNNTKRGIGATVLNLDRDASPEDAAYSLMLDAVRRRTDESGKVNPDLLKRGVTKTVIDQITKQVRDAINSGDLSETEEADLKAYAGEVESNLRNNQRPILQKKANVLNEALSPYGVKVVVDSDMAVNFDNPVAAVRGKMEIDGDGNKILHVSPYLDTDEALAGVVAHEFFHNTERRDANRKLIDDLKKYRNRILSNEGRTSTGGQVDLYSDEDYIRAYADDLFDGRKFGVSQEGNAAFSTYFESHPGTDLAQAAVDLYKENPNAFWSYFAPNAKSGETAQQYMEEEMVAHFIEDLASDRNSNLLNSLLGDDRNLFERLIDAVRALLKLPAKDRQIDDEKAYQKLISRWDKAVANLAGVQAGENAAATSADIPQSDEFRMSREVERVGDLIAVHNLTEKKYLDTHKLGGFPAPSIAVIKAKTGHQDYGPISVVFSSDTIDPQKDSRNRIYGGDAWTPMFPNVEYDYDNSMIWNLDKAIFIRASEATQGKIGRKGSIADAFNGWGMNDSPEDMLYTLSLKRDVQAAYAAANGVKINPNGSVRDVYAELDSKVSREQVAEWLRPIVEKMAGEGRLDVGGEKVPLNAENVVRAMYENSRSRGVDIFDADANGIRSMSAPEFGSIDEVRANKGMLKRLSQNEYDDIVTRLDNYIASIIDDIREFNKDRSVDYDKAILDSIREGGTEEDIRYTFEEAGIGINDKLVRDIKMIYNLAAQLPTEYFEAKPERVVGFAEVNAYIVPDSVSGDTRRMMENDGARVLTYPEGNEKARLKALNSLKDVRFSREMGEIEQRVEDGEPISVVDEVRASRELDAKYQEKAVDVNHRIDDEKTEQFVDDKTMEKAGNDREKVKEKLEEAAEKVHLPDDVTGNTYIANGSYNGTEENTTVCVRSLAIDSLCDAVAEKIGRPLTVEESVFVSQSAFNWTQMPQCMYCYVSMDRMAKRQYLLSYIEKRNQVIADLRSGMNRAEAFAAYKKREQPKGKWKDDGPKTDRFNRWVDNYENKSRAVTMSDLASEKAAERALADPALHDEAYDALDYAQHASWAKKRIGYTAYNNHILNWKQDRIDALNSMFGLRMYSFSDYSPAFVLENMQMITDAAVRGLKMLAYTKDLDFVKIFAPTGMNINISVFSMNQRNADGGFAEDAMQGADWKQAQALRDKYSGVGITYVATNDDQVAWALDQGWIDVIIPFHMVKTGAEVAGIMGYNNYTGESSDRTKKGNKKAEILPNEHLNDKDTYMSLIRERNLKPRFARWQDHPNYMKLVNETRRSAADTPSVQPVFEVGEAEKSIDKMVRQGGYNVPIGGSLERMNQIAEKIGGQIEKGFADSISIRDGIIYQNGQAIHADMNLPEADEDDVRESREIRSEQTETPEFKEWFGDSKVVDKNGEPIVVHHGTTAEFTQFRPQSRASGSHPYYYFSENPEYPKRFMKAWGNADTAKYMDVYLSISNPLDLSGKKQPISEWETILSDAGVNLEEGYFDSVREGYGDSVYGWQLFRSDDGAFQDTVRDAGYDGIKTTESSGDTTWVAFDPTQIKSATDNVGTFVKNNPDIRYSREITPEQDAEYMTAVESGDMDTAQRIVDEAARAAGAMTLPNGRRKPYYHGTTAKFTVFDIDKARDGNYGYGFYFSPMKMKAESYGDIAPYYIMTGDDRIAEYDKHKITPDQIIKIRQEYGLTLGDDAEKRLEDWIANSNDMSIILSLERAINRNTDISPKEYLPKFMEVFGYDGLRHTNETILWDNRLVKSADPVTYDDEGNVIPVSERFNTEEQDFRYSREVSTEQDREYMTAVESGDTEKQRRMVDDAAKAAGYNYRGYHGTNRKFTTFIPGYATGWGKGIYVASNMEDAENYGSNVMPVYLKIENPYTGQEIKAENTQAYKKYVEDYYKKIARNEDITVEEAMQDRQKPTVMDMVNDEDVNYLNAALRELGYDGIIMEGSNDITGTEMVVFDPSQVKSADPIAYDDDGNIIPPSERFNTEEQDIRYSREIESLDEKELRKKLRESEQKVEYLKKQLTQRTAFGKAQAIKPEAFNKEVNRIYDMVKYSTITKNEIETGLRELFDIFERPLKGQSDTAEARWNEAIAKAEELAGKWAGGAVYEKVLNPEFGDNIDVYQNIYQQLRKDPVFYIKPDMIANAADAPEWKQLRKRLSYMRLLGVNSNKEGVESGRMSVDKLYTDLSRDFPEYFPPEGELASGEMNGEYAKLQRIADVGETAFLAAHNPYSVEQTVDEQAAKIEMRDDLLHRFFDLASPTKASERPSENDVREAYAQGQEEGRRMGRFENEAEVGAARMREEMMEQRFREDAEHLKQSLNNILEDRENRIRRIENRLAQRGVMDRVRIERNRVMRGLTKLNRLLENPTRKQHIPQNLRAPVARLLEQITSRYVTDAEGKLVDVGTRLPSGQTITGNRMYEIWSQELDSMRSLAQELRIGLRGGTNAADTDLSATEAFMRQLSDQVDALQDYYNRIVGPQHSADQRTDDLATTHNVAFLSAMGKIVDMAVHAIDQANQFTIQGKNYAADQLGNLLTLSLRDKDSEGYGRQKRSLGSGIGEKLRNIGYETMSADQFFGTMGGAWTDIVDHAYREGQNRQAKHESQYVNYMKELLGDYDNMAAKRNLIPVRINGKDLNVTKSQLMQLYATYQRPAGRTHLENGGACFVDDRGRESREYTFRITPEVYNDLMSHLTDEDKRIADGLVKFMADHCSEWGNDASMYMYGFRMYEDPNYIPLDVVNYSIPKEIAEKMAKTKSIENASFTNPLKRNSVVPLRMTDIFDIANNHVRRMAAYNAYAPITNDMNRIMKIPGMSEMIQDKMGQRGMKYLTDFIQTVAANEVRSGEMSEAAAPLMTLFNNYKRQAVAWNVSTMLKQPISVFRALNEIDAKYLIGNEFMNKAERERINRDMLENSGVAYIKSNGYSDTGLGKTMEKLYTQNYVNDTGIVRGALNESKIGRGVLNAYDWITEAGMAGAGRMDERTWQNLWKACERETDDKYPSLKGEERIRRITRRFNDIIGKTQVVDTILDSAPIQRNKAMQLLTPFMNEPTKSLGGMIAAAKDGRKKFGKAVALFALSNMLIEPLITSLMSMWRDEKEDTDDFLTSLTEKMFGWGKDGITAGSFFNSNMISGMTGLPIISIFADTIGNATGGYSNEKLDTAAISDLVNRSKYLVQGMMKDKGDRQKTMYRLWGDWAESVAAVFGLPARTVRKELAGTARTVMDITNSDWAKWQYAKLYYNLDNASARSQKGFYDIMASAYKRGDAETYQKMREELNQIVTDTPSVVSAKNIEAAIEKGGGELKPGTAMWNVDVQARFRLDRPVTGGKVENFITRTYVNAEKQGVDKSAYDDVLLNFPDAYDYETEDGEKIEMDGPVYDQYTSDVGDLAYKTVSELASVTNADRWKSLSIDQQIYAFEKVYAYAKAKFKKDINPDYNINSQGKWMAECYDANATPAQIAAAVMTAAEGYDKQKKRTKK